jgi:hypothetical protein
MNRIYWLMVFTIYADLAAAQTQAAYWGAVAYAVSGNRAVVKVVTNYPTQIDAERAALTECRKEGVGACQIGTVFANGGCGYATTGRAPPGKVGVGIGWGTTPENATLECRKQGAICDKEPVGYCTKRP